MSDFSQQSAYEYVTLVDRAATGGCEIVFDGHRIPFKPGQVERPVPQFLAEWIFRVDQHKVHTRDGQYVCRFALKDAPPDLLARVGLESADQTPIEIDGERIEGWDTESGTAERGNHEIRQIGRRPGDYQRLGAPAVATFGKER